MKTNFLYITFFLLSACMLSPIQHLPIKPDFVTKIQIGVDNNTFLYGIRADIYTEEIMNFNSEYLYTLDNHLNRNFIDILNKQKRMPIAKSNMERRRTNMVFFFFQREKIVKRISVSEIGEIFDNRNQYQMNQELADFIKQRLPDSVVRYSCLYAKYE